MGKYSPLKEFLTNQNVEYLPMTFDEIEKVLDLRLPASKRYPAWWSNNPSNNPMTREWLAAGFETESVNIGAEKLVFRRGRRPRGFAEEQITFKGEAYSDRIVAPRGEDPLFGCMVGTLTLLPDVDYTAPADLDWGKVYDD